MKKIIRFVRAALVAVSCALLGACAIPRAESPQLYDLGPAQPVSGAPALPAIAVAEIGVPAWLDRPLMFFRLNYQNEQQPRPYAHSRWTMSPGQLVTQRLKTRIAQAGGVVLSPSDGALNVPVLHIEADDFMQSFDAPSQSSVQIILRASLFKERALVAQKTFSKQAPAPSADASGGVRALATATDAAITDMMQWLAALPLK